MYIHYNTSIHLCSHVVTFTLGKTNWFLQAITQLFHRSDLVPARPQTLVPCLIEKDMNHPMDTQFWPVAMRTCMYIRVHTYMYTIHRMCAEF